MRNKYNPHSSGEVMVDTDLVLLAWTIMVITKQVIGRRSSKEIVGASRMPAELEGEARV